MVGLRGSFGRTTFLAFDSWLASPYRVLYGAECNVQQAVAKSPIHSRGQSKIAQWKHACATFACERNQTDTNFKYLTVLFDASL